VFFHFYSFVVFSLCFFRFFSSCVFVSSPFCGPVCCPVDVEFVVAHCIASGIVLLLCSAVMNPVEYASPLPVLSFAFIFGVFW